ncbi:MAG: glycosyltransferase [Fimbriimonadaceae bacterium]
MKILIVNDYLEGRQTDVESGLYPRHHLWGADALQQAGHEITYLERQESARARLLIKVQRLARGRLADLELEDRVRRASFKHDLIYCCAGHLRWLPALRYRGRFAKPIVGWTFMPPGPGANRGFRFLETLPAVFLGHDLLLALTPRTRDEYRSMFPGVRTEYVAWGADTELFAFSKRKLPGEYILCCGRTLRDFETLLAAAKQAGNVPITLLSPGGSVAALGWPENVRIVRGPSDDGATDKGIPYPELAETLMGNARAIVIPLQAENTTAGYTNLIEAAAMRFPVIMSKNTSLDPALLAGCVTWEYPVGDANALANALVEAWSHPDGARRENATEPTYCRFSQNLVQTFIDAGLIPHP